MIQTITLIALWLASGLLGVGIVLWQSGGVDALTNRRGTHYYDDATWMLAILGPLPLFFQAMYLLPWAMPRLMRFLFKR